MIFNRSKTHKGLTAVDSREASVISRLPLRPSSAGTRMNTSVTSLKTGQCCKVEQVRSELHHSAVNTLIGIYGARLVQELAAAPLCYL